MNNPRMNLQLFAEGGAGAGAAGSDGGQAAAAGMENQAVNSPLARGRRSQAQPAVTYGRQAQPQVAPAEKEMDAAGQKGPEGKEREDFESLISGPYKADFEKRVQGIVNERLKGRYERDSKVAPILEIAAQRYGMDASDMEKLDLTALAEKMASDTSQYEQEAADKGLPVEVVAQIHTLERLQQREARAAEMRRQFDEQMRAQRQIEGHYQSLQKQAEEVKKVYPGFDLDAELKNKAFLEMTKPGSSVDVMTAYRAVHHDELAGAEMRFAAQKSAQRISASVAANGRRPAENGIGGSAAAINKTDPRTFTREDFKNIREQVKKGKKIIL